MAKLPKGIKVHSQYKIMAQSFGDKTLAKWFMREMGLAEHDKVFKFKSSTKQSGGNKDAE